MNENRKLERIGMNENRKSERMGMDTGKKLSGITIALHWLVAAGILCLSMVGIYMVENDSWNLYHWHKSIGLLLFVPIAARVLWRLKNGLPPPVRPFSHFEHLASKIAHCLLLAGTLAMPLSGMLYSSASGHGFGIFGLELVTANPHPAKAGEVIPYSLFWSDVGQSAHGVIGYLLLALIAMHLAGAVKHHVLDKDATLKRMLGFTPD
jgi:cytochrome b561